MNIGASFRDVSDKYDLEIGYSDDHAWYVGDGFSFVNGHGDTRLDALLDYAKELQEWAASELQSISYAGERAK